MIDADMTTHTFFTKYATRLTVCLFNPLASHRHRDVASWEFFGPIASIHWTGPTSCSIRCGDLMVIKRFNGDLMVT